MTDKIHTEEKRTILSFLISIFFTALIFIPAVFLSSEIALIARRGLSLAFTTVIPSVFPFIILTDFSVRFIRFESVGALRKAFERLFGISGVGLSAFVSGVLGGFPLGAHRAIELYKNGKISKDECQRLMGFSNNASPAYVICAVGAGILRSVQSGILLYFITLTASVLSGIIAGKKSNYLTESTVIYEQNYSFVGSVKSAAAVSINIAAFITAFSTIAGIISIFLSSEVLKVFILPFFEIGGAVVSISELYAIPRELKLSAIAFAISFSGLSVYAQTASLTEGENISMKPYILIKLCSGIISAILTFFVFSLC